MNKFQQVKQQKESSRQPVDLSMHLTTDLQWWAEQYPVTEKQRQGSSIPCELGQSTRVFDEPFEERDGGLYSNKFSVPINRRISASQRLVEAYSRLPQYRSLLEEQEEHLAHLMEYATSHKTEASSVDEEEQYEQDIE